MIRSRTVTPLPFLAALVAVLVMLGTTSACAASNPFVSHGDDAQAVRGDAASVGQHAESDETTDGSATDAASPFTASNRALEASEAPSNRSTSNPFAANGGTATATQDAPRMSSSGGAMPWSGLLVKITRVQRTIRAELSSRLRALKVAPDAWGLLAFLALAFGYGAVHAAGPGHGKAVATSFVIARGERPSRAALLGMTMGAAHAASAALLILGLHTVLERSLMARFQASGLWVERASYALVCAIALWLVYEAAMGGHDEQEDIESQRRGFWATGLATGMVPCPGAAIVLLFSLALGATGIGLAAVAAMALGMGVTIAAAGVLASCCGRGALALSASRPGLSMALRRGLGLCGGVLIFLFGAALLYGTWH